jgi:hypothetical protein
MNGRMSVVQHRLTVDSLLSFVRRQLAVTRRFVSWPCHVGVFCRPANKGI